jgi:phosphoenolpyruvate carboxykinase (ATP)
MSETGLDPRELVRRLPDPTADNVLRNPDDEQLRELATPEERTTEFDSPSFVSEYRSRCADRTRNRVDDQFTADDWRHCEAAVEAAADREMLCLDRVVGRHPAVSQVCRLYVPREHARIALAWGRLLEPAPEGAEPDLATVQLPDHDEVAIRVLPEAGFTAVLGSDYTGEAKKSFLRLYMYRAKQAGGLGIHAGSKRLHLQEGEVGQLFLGLSGTGKTTLTGHGLWLDDPEHAEMLQDDVCAMLPDGTVAGSEGAGLYIKTLGLDAAEQPALCEAATAASAVLENVAVAEDGTVDFDDDSLTANGRAVVQRADLPSASDDVDLPAVDQVFFITRNPLMPAVARLTPEQAAAAFVLGESVQTSAGDPDAAGESVRVVGTNPFIVGPGGEEGNRFMELVRANDVECFLLNTGSVGDRGVGVDVTVGILEGLARGDVTWRADDAVSLELPEHLGDVPVEELYPPECVEEFERRHRELRADRRAYLRQFERLDDEIRESVY